jgi:hypothetical protein
MYGKALGWEFNIIMDPPKAGAKGRSQILVKAPNPKAVLNIKIGQNQWCVCKWFGDLHSV